MSFLPDVQSRRAKCATARASTPETLAVRFKGKSIGEVLAMNVDEAVEFFAAHRSIHHCLQAAAGRRARLSHARPAEPDAVGRRSAAHQAGDRASEGDAEQDLPTARRAARPHDKHTLYVLDEPTVGLHMADVEKLIRVLHRLVDAGNTVVVIEHNLDVMAEADWIIDLGPEGGDAGGRIVAQGAPETVADVAGKHSAASALTSHTAAVLAPFLAERKR